MRPLFNSFPHQPQQFQSSSAVENQCSNNINMLMMQPQMGSFNPQPPMLNNVGFMNGTNQLLPTQNNHLGFPQFGPIFPNLNNVSMFQQLPGQFNNPLHNPNQPNWLNLPQQNNMGFTNGQQQQQQQQQHQQLFLQNQLQSMSQLLNVQIPNLSQFVSGGQTMGFLNPTVVPNRHFGFMQPNQIQQLANQSQQHLADVNASKPLPSAAASQVLGDPSFRRPQGDPGKNGQNLNNFPGRNVKRDSKWGFQKSKFQQSRFQQADNAKRKFSSSNGYKKKGQNNERAAKFPPNSANSDKEKRRSFALTYTEQEIQQWREERKKYYPTKGNIKKKLSAKVADSEVAKLRSEQLKEILTKQAELGVEVAEIPSHYLLGSEKKVNGREENSMPSPKRGRFEMRHDKRGRYDKRDRFNKKRRSNNKESFDGASFNKRSPTLLQKLLSADIRKDKSHLLQVFRFMVINSFFKDWPEIPLKFPLVVGKDGASEGEIVQEKSLLVGKDNIEVCNKTMIQSTVDGDSDCKNKDGDAGGDHGNHNENDDDIEVDGYKYETQVDQVALYVREKADIGEEIVRNDEEEGEIIN